MNEEQFIIPNFLQAQSRTIKWLETEFESVLQKFDAKPVDFESKMVELESKFESQQKLKKIENINIFKLKEDLDLKKTKKLGKEKVFNVLEEELMQLKQELESIKNASESKTNVKHLIEELKIFSQFLGLQINKVKGGWLQFVFTEIDVNKPDSCYIFSLKLDSTKKYIVADCQPDISDMNYLVEKLNSTNNLSAFVHAVRRRFLCFSKK
ncbi:kinetochore-associated Ndc80 complex subunit spc25 [Bulinus truncatus]|nr:kinetochore-associated Ndc80 complex subunit spc25 [Bulinus truncatus]